MPDLTGQTFGRLTVLGRGKTASGKSTWRCACGCGNETFSPVYRLLNGEKQSCGCLRLEGRLAVARTNASAGARRIKLEGVLSAPLSQLNDACVLKGCDKPIRSVGFCAHHYDMWNRYGHPLIGVLHEHRAPVVYRGKERKIWNGIKRRCFVKTDPNYARYGARGITMCAEWAESFDAFFAAMGECPAGGSIERKDVNGCYEPSNCRWAFSTEQNRNTRRTRLSREAVAKGKSRLMAGESVADIARDAGIKYMTMYQALRGVSWSDVEAA